MYLQFIFTDKRKEKLQIKHTSNTAVPSLWVNDASTLSSEENQEEGLLRTICTLTLKSTRVWANTDIGNRLNEITLIFCTRRNTSNRRKVIKISATSAFKNYLWNDKTTSSWICINISRVRNIIRSLFASSVILKLLKNVFCHNKSVHCRQENKICAYCLSTGSHFRTKIIRVTHYQPTAPIS